MQTIIRAKDYLPEQEEGRGEGMREPMPSAGGLPVRLFGSAPDYTQKEYEDLWQSVLDADEQEMIAFCREKGVDVLDDDGHPVPEWRDVAVMLKAVDAGLVSFS